MRDGEYDAALDPQRAFGIGSENPRNALDPQPTPSAPPRERSSLPADDSGRHRWQAEPKNESTQNTGGHVDGVVSVAALISRLGAPLPGPSTHHHVASEIDPSDISTDVNQDLADPVNLTDPNDLEDTLVLAGPAYTTFEPLSELPDLEASNYPPSNDDEFDTASENDAAPQATQPARWRIRGTSTPKSTITPSNERSHRRPMLVAGRSLAAGIATLTLVLTGGAWQWSTSKNNQLNFISALDPNSQDIVDPNGQHGDENFLMVGMDSRAGANADMGAGDTEDAGGARSDTVMLVNIPANRKRVVVVSFPRDLAITPLQCEAWNPDTGKYGPIYDPKTGKTGPRMVYTETKLNSAFSYGGPKCLVKVIQKLSGLSINRFIAIDFVGFARMVEVLGGVEVCTKRPLRDYELGTILEHPGHQVINGPTALNYVRARKVTTEENGDYGRIKRQQLFLSSLLRSLISEDTLLNLNKLNNVVNMFIGDSYVDNVKTRDLVELGQSLQGVAAGHITFVTVPTGVTDQNGDEPPRAADMRALFDAIIDDDPLPGENDTNAQTLGKIAIPAPTSTKAPETDQPNETHAEQVTTTSPQEVTVQVSNSTGQSGLAATATNQLERSGFNVMTPNDYPSSLKTTTVFFSPGNEQAAATVASAFVNSKIQRITGIGQVVQVVLAPDFSTVTTPAPSGSSMSVQIGRNLSGLPATLPEDLTVTNAADTTCA